MDTMVATVQEWLNNTYSLGVTADGNFGSGTLSACPTLQEVVDVSDATESNLIYILQGSFWCKGYNPGGFTGIFGSNTTSAVKEFQSFEAKINNLIISEPA